jgi:hypothetical protein
MQHAVKACCWPMACNYVEHIRSSTPSAPQIVCVGTSVIQESAGMMRYGVPTQYCLSCQAAPEWEPGSRPVCSAVPPPPYWAQHDSRFNRSKFEVFEHHTTAPGQSGDAQGDRLLDWATSPKFKADRVRFVKMRTMGRKAIFLAGYTYCSETSLSLLMAVSAWCSSSAPCMSSGSLHVCLYSDAVSMSINV